MGARNTTSTFGVCPRRKISQDGLDPPEVGSIADYTLPDGFDSWDETLSHETMPGREEILQAFRETDKCRDGIAIQRSIDQGKDSRDPSALRSIEKTGGATE